jgi:type II secretory pathway predicted ATPase ExeA
MPYLAHFGLSGHPFGLTPNTQHYFPTAANTQILQSLDFAIARNSGIMKVVGEVGTGKTLLCRLLLRRIEARAEIAYLTAPQTEGDALIALVCHEFNLGAAAGGRRAEMLTALNAFLVDRHAENRDCVLVIDEAQALGHEGLETVRLLSNLETETAKLLQIVLFGQTELDGLLDRADLRQVNQRIAFGFSTGPLTAAEAVAYIHHRLRLSRQDGIDWRVFDARAVDLIVRASGGVPRVINILCDKALLIAYGDGAREVGRRHARGAVKDSSRLLPAASGGDRRGRRLALIAALGGLVIGAAVAAAVAFGPPLLARFRAPVASAPPAPQAAAEATPAPPTKAPPAKAPPAKVPLAKAPLAPPQETPQLPSKAPPVATAQVVPAAEETPVAVTSGDTAAPAAPGAAVIEIRSASVRRVLAPEVATGSPSAVPRPKAKPQPPKAAPATSPQAAAEVAAPPATEVEDRQGGGDNDTDGAQARRRADGQWVWQ